MPRKHWAFDAYLALTQNGKTGDEAKAFLLANFPELEDGYLTRILDNMGDTDKADIDYGNQVANQEFRNRLEALRGQKRRTFEIADEFFNDKSYGRPMSASTRGRQTS